MKVLYLHYSLGTGGAERFLVDLSNRVAYKHDVTVLTVLDSNNPSFSHYLTELSPKVKFINLHQQKSLTLSSVIKICRIIKKVNPDIVHAHCSFWLLLVPSIIFNKVGYVMTIHSVAQRWAQGHLSRIISGWLYKKYIQPVTISNQCHQSYVKYYHMANDVLIENGREVVSLSNNFQDVKRYIESFKNQRDTPVFIHIARHHPVKNHNRMFKTFKRLYDEGVDFQLIVIGDKYDSYLTEFEHHTQIHIIGKRDNVGDYLSCSDYFVLTSDNEGLPISLLEAMSMGVIPICTPAGGIADVIIDGVNGYMSDTISDDAFYSSVRKAISERYKLRKCDIQNAYESNYSMKRCSSRYVELYKELSQYDKK